MSEWYLRDVSRKVKASHKARGSTGQRLTFSPIFGYRCKADDKKQWEIDPEAAEVVQRIFNLTIEGKGPCDIARILAESEVERPSYHMTVRGIANHSYHDMSHPYAWSGNTIVHIIGKPEYMGHTVNFRTYKDSYKDKKTKHASKDDWVIFENTHPAIIDPETWETAQRCRKTVRRTDSLGEANPLTGLVFCGDCGYKMYAVRGAGTLERKHAYTCGNYRNRARNDFNCTTHYIRKSVLKELVLADLQRVLSYVKQHEDEFIRKATEYGDQEAEKAMTQNLKALDKARARMNELDTLFRKLYEDNALGKITDKQFVFKIGRAHV